MKIIKTSPGCHLFLGHKGEKLALQIVFDIGSWLETYGPGTAHLLHQRKGDAEPYPVGTVQEGSQVFWNVSDSDTAVEGAGHYELHFYTGESLVKSITGDTLVTASLAYGTEPPEPVQLWLDHVAEEEHKFYQAVTDAKEFSAAAKEYSINAQVSEQNASIFEQRAATHELGARNAEDAAVMASNNAAQSEQNSKTSETNAAKSEEKAKAAEESANKAKADAENASSQARIYSNNAQFHQQGAETARSQASTYEKAAASSADQAKGSATAAAQSEAEAKKAAEEAKNAGGGSGIEVTAKPGQLIRVKEVGENGNPTAWEAVPWGYTENDSTLLVEIKRGSYSSEEIPFIPVIGKEYDVAYGGVTYHITAKSATDGELQCVYIGNGSLKFNTEENTGAPWIYFGYTYNGVMVDSAMWTDDTIADDTIFVYQNTETAHPIPGELLPEGVHYVEKGGMVEILPMTESTLNVDNFPINTKIEGVEVGKSYVVNYNGTEYTCVGQDFTMLPGAVMLGNRDALEGTGDSGEPFVFVIFPDEMFEEMGVGGQVLPIDGAETLSISISAVDETLHGIDPRLLPNDLVKDILIVNVATLDGDFKPVTASHTGSDLKGACLFGKKAALFAYKGKTLPLITVSDTEVTAEFGNIYFSNGSLLRDYVVIDVDGNITTYEMGATVTI